MKKLAAAVAITSALTLSAGQAIAQKPEVAPMTSISANARQRLDSLFRYLETTGLFNGNILVAAGGQKAAFAAIGYANLETREPLTEASTFELASVSKQFTAVGVLRLVDAGKLALDQKLATIFPSFPYGEVTIRQLLNHTCGLPDYIALLQEHWDKTKIATNKDVMEVLTTYHPAAKFAPGSSWEYSNTGYAVLASVIEKISGKSYAAYMHDAVFTPLHLDHTLVYMRRFAPKTIPGYAYGYVQDTDGSYRLPDAVEESSYVVYLDGIAGDGAVNTTVGDLMAWNNAMHDGKLVSAARWKEAITPPVIDGKSTGYGFGLVVTENPERGRVLMHNGGWPGYRTWNVLYLDKNVSLIVLSNKESSPAVLDATQAAVKNIVFDKPAAFPKPLVQVAAEVDKSLYKLYAGTYVSKEMPDFELVVRTDGAKLYTQATGQGELEITPESPNRFFVQDFPIGLEFIAEEGKPAKTLVLHQNGDHEFSRK